LHTIFFLACTVSAIKKVLTKAVAHNIKEKISFGIGWLSRTYKSSKPEHFIEQQKIGALGNIAAHSRFETPKNFSAALNTACWPAGMPTSLQPVSAGI